MTNSNKLGIVAILIAVIALGVVVFQKSSLELGGVTEYQKKSFVEGFFAGTGREVEVTRSGELTVGGGATIGGGTLNVTTANTATSTIIGGCFQFYATSTATALKFQASTTPGVMYSQYGSCPNL
jgi:hypothetical protein